MSQHDFVKQTFQDILTKLELADAQTIQIQLLRINELEKTVDDLIENATVNYQKEEYEKTKELLYSRHGDLYIQLAHLYEQEENFEAAELSYFDAISYEDNPHYYWEFILCILAKNNLSPATDVKVTLGILRGAM